MSQNPHTNLLFAKQNIRLFAKKNIDGINGKVNKPSLSK